MSPQLALVGLSIVPPVAGLAIVYGRYVRGISKKVQVIVSIPFRRLVLAHNVVYFFFSLLTIV